MIEPKNKAAIQLLDEWFEGEPTEPTPEPEPFKIGQSVTNSHALQGYTEQPL